MAGGNCTACDSIFTNGCTAVACNAGFHASGTASNDLGCSMCAAVTESTTRTCNGSGAAGILTVTCNAGFYEIGTASNDLECSLCAAGSYTNTGTSLTQFPVLLHEVYDTYGNPHHPPPGFDSLAESKHRSHIHAWHYR